MNVRKKLTVVERHFASLRVGCTHCLPDNEDGEYRKDEPSTGECRCEECLAFMKRFGAVFGRSLGDCKECMGDGWRLQKRDIPLDENGVPVRQQAETQRTRVIGQSNANLKRRPLPKKRFRNPAKGASVPTKRDWKNRGK